MRQWKLTPEEEAEVLERYDQSTPEIKRGIALEFAKRAIEGAVLVRKFQAALDAERAKVAGLAAACEAALGNLSEVPGRERQWACVEIEAALRAAKEGTGPVQPTWQPIETAPKDREIVTAQIDRRGDVQVADFGTIWGSWREDDGNVYWGWTSPYNRCEEPTHWMEMPRHPIGLGGEGTVPT